MCLVLSRYPYWILKFYTRHLVAKGVRGILDSLKEDDDSPVGPSLTIHVEFTFGDIYMGSQTIKTWMKVEDENRHDIAFSNLRRTFGAKLNAIITKTLLRVQPNREWIRFTAADTV